MGKNKGKKHGSERQPDQGAVERPSTSTGAITPHSSAGGPSTPQTSARGPITLPPSAGARPSLEEYQSSNTPQPQVRRGDFGSSRGRGFARRPDSDRDRSAGSPQGPTSENPVFHEKKGGEWQRTGEQQASSSYSGQQGDEVRLERRDQRGRGDYHARGRGDYHARGRGDYHARGRGDYHARGRGDYHARGRGHERSDHFEQERHSGDQYVESRGKHGRGRGRDKEDQVERGRGRGSDTRFERQEQGRGRGWVDRRDQRGRGDFHGQRREQDRRESIESIQSGSRVEIPELTWGEISQPPSPVIRELTPIASTSQPPMATTQSPPATVSSLVHSVEQHRISSGLAIPHRKNLGSGVVGTKGEPIMVEVNHLALKFKKTNAIAIHYDVEFQPTLPRKLLRQVINEFKQRHLPNRPCAFDGRKNLYSCGKLPFGDEFSDTITIFDEERQMNKECKLKIKFASTVDMSLLTKFTTGQGAQKLPQEAIQALDIVLRHPSSMRFTPVGRSFFSPPRDPVIDLGDGLELWRGFYQSVILAWKPYLNVDVAHKGFPRDIQLIKFVMEMMRTDNPDHLQKPLQQPHRENLEKFVKGLKVEYQIPNQLNTKRVFKVNRLKGPANNERFQLDDNRTMTVGEYFEKEKNYRLRFPFMPCVHVGNENKTIYMPIELCKIVKGQSVNRKLNSGQTSVMVRSAAKPTDERKQRIMEAISAVGFNKDPCVQDFGVEVSSTFLKVQARILGPPMLQYANKKFSPIKGVWKPQMFLNTIPLKSWTILNLSEPFIKDRHLSDFSQLMIKSVGPSLGLNISPPHDFEATRLNYSKKCDQLVDCFKRFIKKYEDLQLIIVVIDEKEYGSVKQAAELKVGVLTQCIKAKTMSKMNYSTCSNILLKVNAKLNGINNSVTNSSRPKLFEQPVMIVGGDVTHPAPGEDEKPSVAAVTSSFDPTGFKCTMSYRIQPPRQELIVDLQNIMYDHLFYFYNKNNGLKPQKIIYYRDGVSEGQFSQVLDVEFQAIRQACSRFPNYKPAITILIVQKRHHTRFFPQRDDAEGKGKNVPAGTIVDTEITHPKEMDFYLVSHASLQGTARPTKYHKIWDDNDFNDDDLEELTYYLCHLYSRCTRSVSYPAHTYYAHLAAFRARAYLEGHNINIQNLENEQLRRTITKKIKEENPMFFV